MIPSAFRFPTRAFPPGPSKLSTSIVPDVEKEKENAPAREISPLQEQQNSGKQSPPPRPLLPRLTVTRHARPAPDNVADALPQLPTGCFRTSIRKLRERPRPVAVVFDINTTFEGKAFAMEAR